MRNAITVSETVADARGYLASLGIFGADSFTVGRGTMPRYAARRDTTHAEVRDGLREVGYSVFDAGAVGGAFPDLVVGAHGLTFLVEVKSTGGKPSAAQAAFARDWRGGPVLTVYSLEQALGEIIKHARGDRPVTGPAGVMPRSV